MFQYRFRRIDEFGWWDLEENSSDTVNQFNSKEFEHIFQTRGVHLTLAAPEHQEMKIQVGVKWRMLRTIIHSLMVHMIVSEAYIYFTLIYTEDHISPLLPIKDLINEDDELTTPHKLATGMESSR